jgi:predicted aldo/keto reductase-like oxidoreductase
MIPTRRFGRTEIQMPVFSCGGMRFQQGWKSDMTLSDIKPEIQENLEATVHRALELGINHIETARGYGPSELQLGQVLPTIERDRYFLQTKIVGSGLNFQHSFRFCELASQPFIAQAAFKTLYQLTHSWIIHTAGSVPNFS